MGAYEELAVYKSARTLLAKLTMVFINAPNAYRKTVCVMMYKHAETVMTDIRHANELELGNEERIRLQKDALEELTLLREELACFCKALMLGPAVEQNLLSNIGEQSRKTANWVESDAKRILSFRKNKVIVCRRELGNLTGTLEILKKYAAEHPTEQTESAVMQAESRIRFMKEIVSDAERAYDKATKRLYDIQQAHGKDDTDLRVVLNEVPA